MTDVSPSPALLPGPTAWVFEGIFPGSTTELLDTHALSPAQVRSVLRDNAARLYAVHASELPGAPAGPTPGGQTDWGQV